MSSTFIAHLRPGARWTYPAATALAAALLLSGCSGGPSATAGSTTAGASSAVSTAADATPATSASGTPASTSGAAPTAQTATKALVDGFPAKLIPLMKGAAVQASSLQRSTPLSVASLTETVTAKPADVLAYYTKVYLAQKFTALPGDSVDGTPSKTFVRSSGQENVNVAVVQTGTTATVTVGANVFPASLQ